MLLLFPEMMKFPQKDEHIFLYQRFDLLLRNFTREQKEMMISEAPPDKAKNFQYRII
jgi:hypothetical protein